MAITDRGISSLWFLIAKCQDRILIRSSKLNSTISRPSVYTLNSFTNEFTFGLITWNRCHLCEHGFAMLGYHGGLVTVKRHDVLMKRFFRVSELPVQIRHSALEYTPEKPRDQCPTNSWNGMKWGSESRGWRKLAYCIAWARPPDRMSESLGPRRQKTHWQKHPTRGYHCLHFYAVISCSFQIFCSQVAFVVLVA